MAVTKFSALASPVGRSGDHKQTQRSFARATLPKHASDLFITDLAALAAIEDLRGVPGNVFVEAYLIGRELLFGIETPTPFGRAEAQARVFAGARGQNHSIRDAGEDGSITE